LCDNGRKCPKGAKYLKNGGYYVKEGPYYVKEEPYYIKEDTMLKRACPHVHMSTMLKKKKKERLDAAP